MNMLWIVYYFSLLIICLFFLKSNSNKFINFFFTPFIFGLFGSVWFTSPGSLELAPIISILFLESFILESNGFERLIRPLIAFILILQLSSFFYYFYKKNLFLKRNNLG